MPLNALLEGPPGTGKTSSVWCVARAMKLPVLEMNASNDRGTNAIRRKVRSFCEQVGRRLIILDEADSMVPAAQKALVRLMDEFPDTCFAIVCNRLDKMVNDVQSRCLALSYERLEEKDIRETLGVILEKEGVQWDKKGLDAVLFVSNGDMRTAITCCQAVWSGTGFINEANVYAMMDQPNYGTVYGMLNEPEKAIQLSACLYEKGYNAMDIVTVMYSIASKTFKFKKYVEEIVHAHQRINVSPTKLQMDALIYKLVAV